jgi:hypothetical protein
LRADDFHRHEANYVYDDRVDDLDYGDYCRFGRAEKQLARQKKFPTRRQKRTWRRVSSLNPLQRCSGGKTSEMLKSGLSVLQG